MTRSRRPSPQTVALLLALAERGDAWCHGYRPVVATADRLMRALGVAAVASASTLAGWALLGWHLAGSGDDDPTVGAAASVVVVLGVPYVLAATVLAHRAARVARGPDLPARAVALAAGTRRGGIDWGAAMRAELAAIDDPADRWRFAAGCVRAAVAAVAGRTVYLVAAAAFAAFAVPTFAGSRVMLAGRPEGLLAWVYVVVIVVFVAGPRRSRRRPVCPARSRTDGRRRPVLVSVSWCESR